MIRKILLNLMVGWCVFGLYSCGYRGPLYLPPKPAASITKVNASGNVKINASNAKVNTNSAKVY